MEVLGPIGFTFGALGFIFSTVGTVTEGWENFHRYEEQMELFQLRFGNYERQMNNWNIFWEKTDFGNHRHTINGIKTRVELLRDDMEEELSRHHLTDQALWNRLKSNWNDGTRLKMKDLDTGLRSIPKGLAYTLWKKKKLDNWMNRLKEEVEGLGTLSKAELKRRTADFVSDNPSPTEIRQTQELEQFVETLTEFAQSLHHQCKSTPATNGWALGLRPPHSTKDDLEIKKCAKDVKYWTSIANVDIELVYSLSRDNHTVHEGRLRVGHHRKIVPSQVPSHGAIKGEVPINSQTITCHIFDDPRVRTRPLGTLIHEGFFDNPRVRKAWQRDRARLLRGITDWTLLLWNTNWTQELCCYGLQIEEEVSDLHCFRQLFTAGLHQKDCNHHPWRLRNLGLVLAQLALTIPLRDRGNLKSLELEEWTNSSWSTLYPVDVLERLMMQGPNMDKIRSAIEFCFTDESDLATKEFEPGFLFHCIKSIHNSITEWCDIELDDYKFYTGLSEALQDNPWPKEAYEEPQHANLDATPIANGNPSTDTPQQIGAGQLNVLSQRNGGTSKIDEPAPEALLHHQQKEGRQESRNKKPMKRLILKIKEKLLKPMMKNGKRKGS